MQQERVCEKRYRRKELMNMGLSYENAVLIVNHEYSEKCFANSKVLLSGWELQGTTAQP